MYILFLLMANTNEIQFTLFLSYFYATLKEKPQSQDCFQLLEGIKSIRKKHQIWNLGQTTEGRTVLIQMQWDSNPIGIDLKKFWIKRIQTKDPRNYKI